MVVAIYTLACRFSGTSQPVLVFPTDTPTQPPAPTLTATVSPTPPILAVTETPGPVPTFVTTTPTITSSPQPLCTVLMNVRLRKGPGIDFDQITTLYRDELFVPFAYVPQGRTEGPWVKIYLSNTPDRIGWVTAGSNVIACNLDITTLPPP